VLLPSRATQRERIARWRALPREPAAARLERDLEAAGFRPEAFAPATAALRHVPEEVDATRAPLPGLEILLDRHLRRDANGLSILVSFSPRDRAALEQVAERLEALSFADGVIVTVTGRPLMESALGRVARREMLGFLGAVLLGTLVLIGARERRLRPTLGLVAIPAASTVLVLGLAAALGIPLNPVTVAILPLTIGLGMEGCLFLVERYRETGDVGEAVAVGGRVVTITSATTITGFGVLALSRYPAMSSLGFMAALSLSICFFVTVLLLPALVSPAWLRQDDKPEADAA
jgi:predicted exporter